MRNCQNPQCNRPVPAADQHCNYCGAYVNPLPREKDYGMASWGMVIVMTIICLIGAIFTFGISLIAWLVYISYVVIYRASRNSRRDAAGR